MRDAMLRPKLLLLDEPSFGLAPLVVQETFRILRTINRNGGVSMLLVEQNANIALELADYAYLIETGCIVMGGPAAIIACDHAVRRAYLGYRTNDSSLVTFQAPLHQVFKGNPVKA